MNLKDFLKTRQQTIVLIFGYLLVAGIAFGLGQITASTQAAPEIRVEEAFLPLNNNLDVKPDQSVTPDNSINPDQSQGSDCAPGQIKGNIGSGGSKVYHMPGGSFYNRTKAETCFTTEAEAQAAGFRKSKS